VSQPPSAIAQAARSIRRGILARAFTLREWLLIEAILAMSLDAGRPEATVHALDDFCILSGMDKSAVTKTLARLRQMLVLVSNPPSYRLLPQGPTHAWLVKPRVDEVRAVAALARHTNPGPQQADLFDPDPDLEAARQAVCIEGASVVQSTTAPLSTRPQPSNCLENQRQTSDSGTVVNVLSVQRLNAFSKKRLNADQETLMTGRTVVESTTEADLMARIAAAVGRDEMARWGADWRKNWVRRVPERVKAALDEWDYKVKTGWLPRNAGAALKDLVKRFSKEG
jgi:hypothetical protein